jgi:hypothetical protein
MALKIAEWEINEVVINTCPGCGFVGPDHSSCLNKRVGVEIQRQRAIKAVSGRNVEFDCEERTCSV